MCGGEGACEKDEGGGHMCVVGRVHVKRTGGSNVCGGEGTCEKDEGDEMCVVGRVHVKRTRGHMCVCISNMEDVYIHTCISIYHSPGKMLNTHRPPPLRSTHTYQP